MDLRRGQGHLEVIFAILQAGFSDFYCRQKSLTIALSVSLVCFLLFKVSMYHGFIYLMIAVLIKGVLGNITPIAWAGLADVSVNKDFRFNLALSICAIALGSWGPLYLNKFINDSSLYWLVVFLICVSVILSLIRTPEAEKNRELEDKMKDLDISHKIMVSFQLFSSLINKECHHIYKFLINPMFLLILLIYFLAEVSFYQILYREEIGIDGKCFQFLPLAFGLGYYLGTVILKFTRTTNKANIIIGVVASATCIIMLFIMSYMEIKKPWVNSCFYAIYSLGFALFIPSTFSALSQKTPIHEQGKIYGLVDSVDTIASITAFAIILPFKEVGCTLILFISMAIFILSAGSFYMLLKRREYEV
jgi:hypothetical protein